MQNPTEKTRINETNFSRNQHQKQNLETHQRKSKEIIPIFLETPNKENHKRKKKKN